MEIINQTELRKKFKKIVEDLAEYTVDELNKVDKKFRAKYSIFSLSSFHYLIDISLRIYYFKIFPEREHKDAFNIFKENDYMIVKVKEKSLVKGTKKYLSNYGKKNKIKFKLIIDY